MGKEDKKFGFKINPITGNTIPIPSNSKIIEIVTKPKKNILLYFCFFSKIFHVSDSKDNTTID